MKNVLSKGKHVFVKKTFTIGQDFRLPQRTWIEKRLYWVKTHSLPLSVNVLGEVGTRDSRIMTVFWDMIVLIAVDYLEKMLNCKQI